MTKAKLIELKNAVQIQIQNGNWNYDEYMFGMANGMILAESIMTGEEPKFKDKPRFFWKALHGKRKYRICA